MNENIYSTGNDWEVDRSTDVGNEKYADEQGKRLMRLDQVYESRSFTLDDRVGRIIANTMVPVPVDGKLEVWFGYSPGYPEGEEPRKWYPIDTIVQLGEPVPDAIVDTVVSDLSVGGDLLSEQIQKIRERNVPEVARMTIQEAIGRYGMNKLTDGQKQEVENWAEQQLQNTDMDKELEKGFTDMLLHNREMYHVTEDKIEHIPYTPEKWDEIHSKHSTDDIQDPVSADEAIKHEMTTEERFPGYAAFMKSRREESQIYKHMRQENPVYCKGEYKSDIHIYHSLEHLLGDLQLIPEKGAIEQIREIAEKLQKTITSGKWLANGTE